MTIFRTRSQTSPESTSGSFSKMVRPQSRGADNKSELVLEPPVFEPLPTRKVTFDDMLAMETARKAADISLSPRARSQYATRELARASAFADRVVSSGRQREADRTAAAAASRRSPASLLRITRRRPVFRAAGTTDTFQPLHAAVGRYAAAMGAPTTPRRPGESYPGRDGLAERTAARGRRHGFSEYRADQG